MSAASGLYLLDPPMAGEPLFEGVVQVEFNGGRPPADTVVDVNGVPLVRTEGTGPADKFWAVDPSRTQPPLYSDGTVAITARSGSEVRSITLTCPKDIAVSSSTPAGTTLSAAASLTLGWATDLSVNATNRLVTDFYTSAHLRGIDLATSTLAPGELASKLVPHGALQAVLPVPPTPSTGYLLGLRWQGPFLVDGNSDGYCGRVKRIVYQK